jgi:hypothetical protein
MSDVIVERVRSLCADLQRVEVDWTEEDYGRCLTEGAVLIIEALAEPEPEWFALASLLAYMEDSARWVIDRRLRALRAT